MEGVVMESRMGLGFEHFGLGGKVGMLGDGQRMRHAGFRRHDEACAGRR
jgi:hypothetical protein